MPLLVFKLATTPLLIGLATVVAHRWGPAVGGWLVALPFISGPVLLFLAVEQGPSFAATAAAGAIAGAIAVSGFCLTYASLARRWTWWATFLGAIAVYAAVGIAVQRIVDGPFLLLLAAAFGAALAGLALLPDPPPLAGRVAAPAWELPARMAVGAALVVGITALATVLGPELSGLLATFPVFISVLGVFTHRREGPARTVLLLRGVLVGIFGTIAFLAVLHVTLVPWPLAAAFGLAVLVVAVVQAAGFRVLRRGAAGDGTA